MPFVSEVGEAVLRNGELTFEWNIRDFFSLSDKEGDYYCSPDFRFTDTLWYLRLYPNGRLGLMSSGWVSLYLRRKGLGQRRTINFKFGFKSSDGLEEKKESDIEYSNNDPSWGHFKCWQRSELRKKISSLPDNFFTITCHLRCEDANVAKGTEDVNVQTDFENFTNSYSEEERQQVKTGSEKVVQDLMKVWRSGDNSDVTIYVKDEEFQAHKVILGARSPVLLAMFQHDTTESRSGEIKISDCEPDVFKEFLSYIYTGAPQELTSQNAAALYTVAGKYLADDLKDKCLKCVRSNLSVDTFCDTVMLALNYGETELLQHAIDFASENIRQIIKSVEWQRFNQDAPTTANEILIKALGS